MISFKIEGIKDLQDSLIKISENLPESDFDKAVRNASEVIVDALKTNYAPYRDTGTLIRSIEAFKRKRKSKKDPYFTYYVGPRYTGRQFKITDQEGNAISGNVAHFLEYGTIMRQRANKSKGGIALGKGRIYGATYSTGMVKPQGVIRRTKDENENEVSKIMGDGIVNAIVTELKKKGFEVK